MGKSKMYRVQRFVRNGVWQTVVEDSSKQFCLGWVLGIDSLYPSAPYRVTDEEGNVLRQTKGRAGVQPNLAPAVQQSADFIRKALTTSKKD